MIEINDLSRQYKTARIFSGLSLSIPDRTAVAITGPSGCGKTTLLRLIAGLDRPDGGEIHISGKLASSPDYLLPPSERSIGFVFQSPALWPHMTVSENILFGLWNLSEDARKERLDELLERARVSRLADRYPHEISGGEAQRVSLLRAIAPRPRHLLMDEPLTNLDEDLRDAMISLITTLMETEDISLVYVTHRRDETERIASITYVLKDGIIREK
jgi:iron(III) transport system ATP-binding protein